MREDNVLDRLQMALNEVFEICYVIDNKYDDSYWGIGIMK
jgi:hypothetical protein